MTATLTKTFTYTQVDVAKTFESFASNLRLFVDSTGLNGAKWAEDTIADVLALASSKYLRVAHVQLWDAAGIRRRVARFTISENAVAWTTELPGDNVWPLTPGGQLRI